MTALSVDWGEGLARHSRTNPDLTRGVEAGSRAPAWQAEAGDPSLGQPGSSSLRASWVQAAPCSGCHSNPRVRRGPRAPGSWPLPEVTRFTCRARARWGGGAEVPELPGSRERARRGETETPGESPLPAVAAHGPAATMALLLRVLLLCGVAGECGSLAPASSLPGQPRGARCLRPPGNNEAWGRGRARFGGAAAVVALRA